LPGTIRGQSRPAIDKQLGLSFVAEALIYPDGAGVIHGDFQMDGRETPPTRLLLNGRHEGGPDAATTICPADVQRETPQRARTLVPNAPEADRSDR
jgi:hypothetical protein